MSKFQERLKFLINTSNKSTRQISREAGVSSASLSLYLSGQREPTKDAIIKLANYFKVSADYLLGLSDNPKSSNDALPEIIKKQLEKLETIENKNLKQQLLELAEKLRQIAEEL